MINIAELLKDAPEGIKLYSPLFGEVELKEVNPDCMTDNAIYVISSNGGLRNFDRFGKFFYNHDGECLLFPSKEVRTWEGWKPPIETNFKVGDWVVRKDGYTFYGGNYAEQITLIEVDEKGKCIWLSSKTWAHEDYIRLWTIQDAKDGDVLMTTKVRNCPFIYRKVDKKNNLAYYYAGIDGNGDFSEGCIKRTLSHFGPTSDVVPATKEQRDLLFKKMKEAGYTWDEKKKELRKIRPHYDIANFKSFDKVLIRVGNNSKWTCDFFSYYHNGCFHCVGTDDWSQCIPFNEDTKHLLGTTDMCPEEYVNW